MNMKARKWLGPGLCVLVAVLILLAATGLLTSRQYTHPITADGRSCEEAGGKWEFREDIGIGCYSPDGKLFLFVND